MLMVPTGFRPGVAEDRAELRARWLSREFHSPVTLPQAVSECIADVEGRIVVRSVERPADMTMKDMHERAMRVASALKAAGIGRGDVVAVQLPSWIEALLLIEAVVSTGALLVPIVTIYGPKELSFILRQTKARMLIIPGFYKNTNFIEHYEELPNLPDLEHVVIVGDKAPRGALVWDRFVQSGTGDFAPPPEMSPDDPCILLYTSGTTSDPKGVLHSHKSILGRMLKDRGIFVSQKTSVLNFPMGHIGSATTPFRLLINGGTVVSNDRWDASEAARMIEEFRVGMSSGPPFFLYSMLEAARAQGNDISSLNEYMFGATSVAPTDVERAEAMGIVGYRCYGSTEHPVATRSFPEDPLRERAHTDGKPQPGTEVRIFDDAGNELPLGTPGEVGLIGPQQFIGYTDPAHNADLFLPGGWFLTGDIGILDQQGCLTITDRKKDIIIRGGENISSKEVEDILATHENILESAAVAMPDERLGEKVCAFVLLRAGASLTLDDVRHHFRAAGAARQKTPERVEVLTEFPRTPSGKVKKFELRQRLSR